MEITRLQLNGCLSISTNRIDIKDTNQLSRQGRRIIRPCARHFQDFLLRIQYEGTPCLTDTPVGHRHVLRLRRNNEVFLVFIAPK